VKPTAVRSLEGKLWRGASGRLRGEGRGEAALVGVGAPSVSQHGEDARVASALPELQPGELRGDLAMPHMSGVLLGGGSLSTVQTGVQSAAELGSCGAVGTGCSRGRGKAALTGRGTVGTV